jgi:hypothetical protein
MARAPHRPFVDDPPAVDPRTGAVDGEDLTVPPREPAIAEPDLPTFLEAKLQENTDRELRALQRTRDKVRTPDGRLRRARFIGAVLGLRFENYTPKQIAAILGVSTAQVFGAMRVVRDDATIAEQLKRMDDQIVPIAVDNVMRAVVDGNLGVSMKLLDGRGVFRSHKSIEAQITEQRVDIRLLVTRPAHMDPNAPLPTVKPGSIAAGTPKGQLADVSVVPEEVA